METRHAGERDELAQTLDGRLQDLLQQRDVLLEQINSEHITFENTLLQEDSVQRQQALEQVLADQQSRLDQLDRQTQELPTVAQDISSGLRRQPTNDIDALAERLETGRRQTEDQSIDQRYELERQLSDLDRWKASHPEDAELVNRFQDQQRGLEERSTEMTQAVFEAMGQAMEDLRDQQRDNTQQQEANDMVRLLDDCVRFVEQQRGDSMQQIDEQRRVFEDALLQDDPGQRQQSLEQVSAEQDRRAEILKEMKDALNLIADPDRRLDHNAILAAVLRGETEYSRSPAERAFDIQDMAQSAEAIRQEMQRLIERFEQPPNKQADGDLSSTDVDQKLNRELDTMFRTTFDLTPSHLPTSQRTEKQDFELPPEKREAAKSLFGQRWEKLETSNNESMRKVWDEVVNRQAKEIMERVADLYNRGQVNGDDGLKKQAYEIATRVYENWRNRFWRTVGKREDLIKCFKDAGLTVERGKAPYYLRADGSRERVTIEHFDTRRTDDPTRAVDSSNLVFSLARENSVMLEAIRRDERRIAGVTKKR